MPCCTYLYGNEHTEPTSDAEINETLAAVRKETGEDWRVAEYRRDVRRWFRRVERRYYELFKGTVAGEFQIINFYRPDKDPDRPYASMNFINPAGYVVAYLYGVLGGVQAAKSTLAACTSPEAKP